MSSTWTLALTQTKWCQRVWCTQCFAGRYIGNHHRRRLRCGHDAIWKEASAIRLHPVLHSQVLYSNISVQARCCRHNKHSQTSRTTPNTIFNVNVRFIRNRNATIPNFNDTVGGSVRFVLMFYCYQCRFGCSHHDHHHPHQWELKLKMKMKKIDEECE